MATPTQPRAISRTASRDGRCRQARSPREVDILVPDLGGQQGPKRGARIRAGALVAFQHLTHQASVAERSAKAVAPRQVIVEHGPQRFAEPLRERHTEAPLSSIDNLGWQE